ncbi:hypothetical protein P5V15_001847 [Pogonomyrmex californicus]
MEVFDTRYFRVNKLLLSFIGLWPFRSSFNKNRNYYCTIIGILFALLPQIGYLFKHTRNLDDINDVLPTLAGVWICLLKASSLHWKYKKFTMLIQHVSYDWNLLSNHDDIWILIKYVERSRTFTLIYLFFISTGVVSFVTAPITIPIFDTILSLNVTRPKQMPHPAEFFVDMKRYYYILLVITLAGYAACSAVAIATDTIYIALLQHVCGVLAILSYRLEKLDVHNKSEYIDLIFKVDKNVEKMIECIQLQIRTERLIKLIESTFAICFLTDIGLGILLQCSACVMIVTDMDTTKIIKHCPILLMQSTRIFFNSWVGQKIIDHSSQISDATYNGRWYQMSLQVKRMVLFVMMKSTKPYCVTMAKLYVICLESYGSLMRASASYITLMLSLTSDDM